MKLAQEDLIALNRFGERYQQLLHQIFAQLPPKARSISGLGKYTGYNRSNSQRIVNAHNAKDGLKVICALPGIEGQIEFAAKIARFVSDTQSATLHVLIEDFEAVIERFARSHASLKRLLATYTNIQATDDNLPLRRQLYQSSELLLGSHIDNLFCCYALTQSKDNRLFLHEHALISKQGITRTPKSPPFVQFYTHDHPAGNLAPKLVSQHQVCTNKQFEIAIAQEFSSDGLAEQFVSYSKSNSGMVFDDVLTGPFDATFLFSNPDELSNPLTDNNHCSSTSISIKIPTKKLTMLVLIERELDKLSSVNLGCYMGNQKVQEGKLHVSDMWTERLPDFPELKVIDLSINQVIKAPYPQEMLDYFLAYFGLDATKYKGYLMETEYPIWSSTYRIYFEHQEKMPAD